MMERFEVALNTPAGRLTTAIDVPTGFIPINAIVPVARRLGEEAAELEVQQGRRFLVGRAALPVAACWSRFPGQKPSCCESM